MQAFYFGNFSKFFFISTKVSDQTCSVRHFVYSNSDIDHNQTGPNPNPKLRIYAWLQIQIFNNINGGDVQRKNVVNKQYPNRSVSPETLCLTLQTRDFR